MNAIPNHFSHYIASVMDDEAPRGRWLRRALDALMRARQADAEREVARLVERDGSGVPAAASRRMERHFA